MLICGPIEGAGKLAGPQRPFLPPARGAWRSWRLPDVAAPLAHPAADTVAELGDGRPAGPGLVRPTASRIWLRGARRVLTSHSSVIRTRPLTLRCSRRPEECRNHAKAALSS